MHTCAVISFRFPEDRLLTYESGPGSHTYFSTDFIMRMPQGYKLAERKLKVILDPFVHTQCGTRNKNISTGLLPVEISGKISSYSSLMLCTVLMLQWSICQ